MSVHSLRIHRSAEELCDRIAIHVDAWTPIHQDGLGRQTMAAADAIGQHIRDAYAARHLDERLQCLRYADAAVQDTKNDLRRALGRALIDDHATTALMKALTGLSISIVEFANAMLQRDPLYHGDHRRWVERRRAWRLTSETPPAGEPAEQEDDASPSADGTASADADEA